MKAKLSFDCGCCSNQPSRRDFLKTTVTGVAALAAAGPLTGMASHFEPAKVIANRVGTPETLVGDPVAGQSVWSSAGCASCHTMRAAGATGTVGPNLDSAKPGQDLVIQRVTNGINVMPAFGDQLNGKQIQDLASFVYKSTH